MSTLLESCKSKQSVQWSYRVPHSQKLNSSCKSFKKVIGRWVGKKTLPTHRNTQFWYTNGPHYCYTSPEEYIEITSLVSGQAGHKQVQILCFLQRYTLNAFVRVLKS